MEDIIDINFNFDLFNKIIMREMGEYDVLKNKYFDGENNGEIIYEEALKIIKLIVETIGLIDFRLNVIKGRSSDQAQNEIEGLKRLSSWYERLKNSLNYEKEKYLSGEFGVDLDM